MKTFGLAFLGSMFGALVAAVIGSAWVYFTLVVPDIEAAGSEITDFVADMELRRASREAGNAHR